MRLPNPQQHTIGIIIIRELGPVSAVVEQLYV